MHALEALEPPDNKEIRTFRRLARVSRCLAPLVQRHEVRKAHHWPSEAARPVCLERELAGRQEHVDVLDLALQQARIPPKLRWPPVRERAAKACGPLAGLTIESPERVHGTDQPVLMCGVELEASTVREHTGTPDQRDVVEVGDVEVVATEQASQL